MDERNLFFRYTAFDQLQAQIVIHVELAVVVRGGEIAEHQLRGSLLGGFEPYPIDVVQAGIDLAGILIREHGIVQPLIEREFSPVVGNLQHVVLIRLDNPLADIIRALGEACHHFPLKLARLYDFIVVFRFRYG